MPDINTRREEFLRKLLGETSNLFSLDDDPENGGSGCTALQKIDDLIGAQPLKTFARELATVAERAKRHNIEARECIPTLLISSNPGNGLSTYLKLIADLLSETELLEFSGYRKVVEMRVKHDHDESGGGADTRQDVRKLFELGDFTGVVALDISEFMGRKLHDTFFGDLLSQVWEYTHQGSAVFAFTMPYLEKQAIEKVRSALNQRLNIRALSFPTPSHELLLEFARKYFAEYSIEWPDECDEGFLKALHAERSDGHFYGFATARRLCQQIVYYKLSAAVDEESDKEPLSLTPGDLVWVLPEQDAGSTDAHTLLDELVGLEEIKERVREIIASIKMQKGLADEGKPAARPMLHMIFSGPPGTGKTTIARIIGKIFKQEGILQHGNFIEVTRRDLVGRYVGHTAVLTTDVCRSAHGSILFIDEAYALVPTLEHPDTFGLEAVATLITEMENNRDSMCVIMAGYAADMDRMLESNAGLRDRFAYRLEFKSYSREQLSEIFFLQMGKLYVCTDEFREAAEKFFKELSSELMNSPTFSNARFVRNLFERVVSKAAVRQRAEEKKAGELVLSDFLMAIADKDFQQLITSKDKLRRVGFLVEEALS